MNDHQGERGIDGQENNTGANADSRSRDALRQEFISAEGSNNIQPSEQRKAEETQQFRKLYREQNIELAPLQNGWGPFQTLEQMVKDKKISLTEEQIIDESRRIRDRDFKSWGRKYYNSSDHTMRWSDQEIEKKVQDTVNRVKGIDVSSYQHTIDWKQVKDAGYQFAFLKASEGIDWVDPTFAANRAGARDAGLEVGYYHYFRPNDSVDEQVQNFVKTVGKAEPNSLRLVIDVEDPKIWQPYTVEQRVKMIDDWCVGVKKELGVSPQISVYGSPSFFNKMLNNAPELAKYSLWIANYNVAEPTLPKPWSKWDFWQYSDSGKVPGITGDVDLNMFNGNDLSKDRSQKKRH